MKSINKHYKDISPLDRFKLCVAAKERDDEIDFNRLIDTCPYEPYSYRKRDTRFIAIRDKAQEIANFFMFAFVEQLLYVIALERQLDAYLACDDVYCIGYAMGFIEAYERFGDNSFNDDSFVSEAKESFAENSLGIGERDRWTLEYEAFRHSVGRLKAVCKALDYFCAADGIEIDHILHFNRLAKVWIAQAKHYLDLPMPIDETGCKLHQRIFQHIWLGQMDVLEFTEKERQYLGQADSV
jgi:hypothetical protein